MNRSSNLNMYLPENSDYRDVSQLSANFSTLDGSVGALADGLAIVSVGNTHAAIASGQYVYIMNHSSLSEGLYRATSAISANTSLSGSNVTAVSGGGINELNSRFSGVGYVAPINWEPSGSEASVTSGTAVDIANVSDLIPSGAAAKGVIIYNAYGSGNYDYAGTLMLVSGKVRYMPRYTQSNIHVYGAIIYTK